MDRSDRDERKMALVCEAYQRSHQVYGYRRVGIWLRRQYGFVINHKAVLRLMRKLNLQSVARRRYPFRHISASEGVHIYPNHLSRSFHSDHPNQKWVTDVTWIKTQRGPVFLSAIKDLYDGFIVGYDVSRVNTVEMVTRSLRKALQLEGSVSGLTLHSDQGHQYCSHAYAVLAQLHGILPSMSRRGDCLDNAPMENFFGHLKEEAIYRQQFNSFEEVQQVVDEYIHFYNYERIQLKTRLTPFEVRCQSV
jgi:putative transposase